MLADVLSRGVAVPRVVVVAGVERRAVPRHSALRLKARRPSAVAAIAIAESLGGVPGGVGAKEDRDCHREFSTGSPHAASPRTHPPSPISCDRMVFERETLMNSLFQVHAHFRVFTNSSR